MQHLATDGTSLALFRFSLNGSVSSWNSSKMGGALKFPFKPTPKGTLNKWFVVLNVPVDRWQVVRAGFFPLSCSEQEPVVVFFGSHGKF